MIVEVAYALPEKQSLISLEVEEGKKLMSESGIDIIAADNLSDAAKKIVSSVKGTS